MKSFLIACAAVTIFVSISRPAEPRPLYLSVYGHVYPREPRQCLKCNICHVRGVRDKKQRNPYGMAIRKALPHRNVRDKQTIMDAIKAAVELKPKPCTSFRDWLTSETDANGEHR